MRKITAVPILAFVAQSFLALALAVATDWFVLGWLPLGDFRGVVLSLAGVVLLYVYEIVAYRLFIGMFPLHEGDVTVGSQQETIYHVYVLFYLIFFNSIMRSGWPPLPLLRAFYLGLGTRLGPNTYCAGIIYDPPFVQIGHDSVVGESAVLVPHVIENERLGHYPIRIGNHVTIGAGSIVLSNVEIGDGAIVATGAVVTKGSRIGPGEVWGGVPARRLSGPVEAVQISEAAGA